jgi:hypothetical protein
MVTLEAIDKKTINAMLLNRSYKLMVMQARRPTKKVNTFQGLTNADIDSMVMTNEAYELMKSANCKPS